MCSEELNGGLIRGTHLHRFKSSFLLQLMMDSSCFLSAQGRGEAYEFVWSQSLSEYGLFGAF